MPASQLQGYFHTPGAAMGMKRSRVIRSRGRTSLVTDLMWKMRGREVSLKNPNFLIQVR